MQISVTKSYNFFHLEFKTLDEAAKFFGYSQAMMSLVFSGKRLPPDDMFEKAGYRKVVTYERIDGEKPA